MEVVTNKWNPGGMEMLGRTKLLRGKPVSGSLRQSNISHWLACNWRQDWLL